MSDQSKIDAFIQRSKDSAEALSKQQRKAAPTQANFEDLAADFNKNRSTVVIGDRVYTIKKFGIRETIHLVPILGNFLGVPLSALAQEITEEGEVGGLTEALLLLFGNMENGALVEVLELLLSKTTIDGVAVDLDDHFDDVGDVLQVAAKIFEVNFQPFIRSLDFARIAGWFQRVAQLA